MQDAAEQVDQSLLGQQAAHLARQLDEGRQAGVQARQRGALLFEPLVGPRVLQGGRGLGGDGGRQADLFLRVAAIGRGVAARQQTENLILIDQRHPQLAAGATARRRVVAGLHGDHAALVDAPGKQRIVAQSVDAGAMGAAGLVAVAHHELEQASCGVVLVDLGAGGTQGFAQVPGDGREHCATVDGRREGGRHAEQRGEVGIAPLGLVEGACVANGECGLRSDGFGQADLIGREAPRIARLRHVKHAQDLVAADQRYRQRGLFAPGGHGCEVLERQSRVVVVLGVRPAQTHRGQALGPRLRAETPTQPGGIARHAGDLVVGDHLELP